MNAPPSPPRPPREPEPTIDQAVTRLAVSVGARERLDACAMLIGATMREATRLRDVIAGEDALT